VKFLVETLFGKQTMSKIRKYLLAWARVTGARFSGVAVRGGGLKGAWVASGHPLDVQRRPTAPTQARSGAATGQRRAHLRNNSRSVAIPAKHKT